MSREPKYIVVIGTSAGGLEALTELVGQFEENIDAAIFIVMHLSQRGISEYLSIRLGRYAKLKCTVAAHESKIERGQIYIAPPNLHLLLKKNEIILGHGPPENRWRPSIDVLFRSAAAAYNGRVIGIVLTGLLDDGTAGMMAIKKCGGKTIVQDPNQAEYPDMPMSVLNNLEVDACVPLLEIGKVVADMIEMGPALPHQSRVK